MQKESQWESIVVTSSKPLTYFYERALKVAPPRDGKIIFRAVAYLDRAIDTAPEDAAASLKLPNYLRAGLARTRLLEWTRKAPASEQRAMGIGINTRQTLEKAKAHIRAALALLSERNPEQWIPVAALLAHCLLLESPAVDSDLEEARRLYEKIEQHQRGLHCSLDRGQMCHNLGMIYHERSKGVRANNIERAIRFYNEALEYRTRASAPYDWATTQSNMGNAYSDRPDADREHSVKLAIECYRRALEVRNRDDHPHDWAHTMGLLGTAHTELGLVRSSSEELTQAADCYKLAMQVLDSETNPSQWASVLANLGATYSCRYANDGAHEDLTQALQSLELAGAAAEGVNDVVFVGACSNLIEAYLRAKDRSQDRAVTDLVEMLENRLGTCELPRLTVGWCKYYIGKFLKIKVIGALDSNRTAWAQQLGVRACSNLRDSARFLKESRGFGNAVSSALRHLAELHERLGERREAIAILEEAIDFIEQMRLGKVVEEAKGKVLLENVRLYFEQCRLYIEEGEVLDALRVADRLKSRALLASLQDHEVLPEGLEGQRLGRRYWQLLRTQRTLLGELSNHFQPRESGISVNKLWAGPPIENQTALELNRRLDDVEVKIAECLGALAEEDNEYVERIHGHRLPSLETYFRKNSDVGILAMHLGRQGVHLFFLSGKSTGGSPDVQLELAGPDTFGPIGDLVDVWFEEVNQLSTGLKRREIQAPDLQYRWAKARNLMEKMLEAYGALLGPGLEKHFLERGITKLIIVPNRDGHVIPFAAMQMPRHLAKDGLKFPRVVDLFESITNLPSLAMMSRLEQRSQRKRNRLFVVAHDDGAIPHTAWEVASLRRFFPADSTVWENGVGNLDEFAHQSGEAGVMHLSTHGVTVVADYHQSHLDLGDEKITSADVVRRLKLENAYVVTLSACETGYSPTRVKRVAWDEYAGMDGAFLQAGARAVVSSIWLASDRSSALLMFLFYRNLMEKQMDSSRALREAQRSLACGGWRQEELLQEFNSSVSQDLLTRVKKLTPSEDFSHPMLWANFKHFGLPG